MGSVFAIILGLGSLAAIGTALLEWNEYRKRKGVTLKTRDRGVEENDSKTIKKSIISNINLGYSMDVQSFLMIRIKKVNFMDILN